MPKDPGIPVRISVGMWPVQAVENAIVDKIEHFLNKNTNYSNTDLAEILVDGRYKTNN